MLTAMRSRCRINMPNVCIPANNLAKSCRNYCQKSQTINKEVALEPVKTDNDQKYEENIKQQILSKALSFVPKSGWSIESLTQGAEALGYPGITHGLFPNGGGDLVHYFNVISNEQLVEEMKTVSKMFNTDF